MKRIQEQLLKLSTEKQDALELSAQKVELAIAGDLKKVTSSMKSAIKKLDSSNKNLEKAKTAKQKAIDAAETASDNGIKAFQDAGDTRNNAVDVLNKAEAAAKELGVNPNDVTGFKDAMDAFSSIDTLSDKNNDLRNELNSI